MENKSFDREIAKLLEGAYQAALKLNKAENFSPEQIKMLIIATNLEALANTLLLADESGEEDPIDFKKAALGLYGTIDWIKESL